MGRHKSTQEQLAEVEKKAAELRKRLATEQRKRDQRVGAELRKLADFGESDEWTLSDIFRVLGETGGGKDMGQPWRSFGHLYDTLAHRTMAMDVKTSIDLLDQEAAQSRAESDPYQAPLYGS